MRQPSAEERMVGAVYSIFRGVPLGGLPFGVYIRVRLMGKAAKAKSLQEKWRRELPDVT